MFQLYQFIQGLSRSSAGSFSEGEHRLAHILEIPVDQLAALGRDRRYYYRPFSILKRDGRERRILAPSPPLKDLERKLLHRYLSSLPIHPAARAFKRGASIVANAQQHAGQALIAMVDLMDFFEATSAARVRAFFIQQGWTGSSLNVLMRLCVYGGGLPQGAPTSPCLSNVVNWDLDEALSELARRGGARYTRYGDDLAFSWPGSDAPAYFEAAVTGQVLRAGYRIQPRKPWRVYRADQEPQLTGVVLGRDGQVRASSALLARVRWLRWCAWWKRDEETLRQLAGYHAFLKTPGLKR